MTPYLPEGLEEGMDHLQKKLVGELIWLENFIYIHNWIIVRTHEDMEWEPAREETTNRGGSLLLDILAGGLVEAEANIDSGTDDMESGKMQQDIPRQEEAAILASSLQLNKQS
uniref:Uncharacterized protein n=1 Tax=Romanomermis culicivorax TaxID=13658 RepID=A0A915JXV5_ROMCU